jgi:hypothetical protein
MTRSANTSTRRNARVRCAIYTRKSSEEGLEQEFNSLQAQRLHQQSTARRLGVPARCLPRPIDGGDGTGRLTRCRGGAVNLWTVGCADPRLTAQARSPMDELGKTPCVSPTLPTGRRLPTSFTAPAPTQDEFDFGEW